MAEHDSFIDRDLARLAGLGIEPHELERQLQLLLDPPPPAALVRPCRVGDGIVRLPDDQQPKCIARWQSLTKRQSLAKFVPASGAATRMFRDLTTLDDESTLEKLRQGLGPVAPNFAFRQRLLDRLACEPDDGSTLSTHADLERAAHLLIDESGLGYGQLPKGLIPFHAYPIGERTALVEHLYEGIHFLDSSGGICRFHFTVTVEHERAFRRQVGQARAELSRNVGDQLEVEFSSQSPATDTLAVDMQGRPARLPDGSLLLRPAGHGALIENIGKVDADVAIIKNIDNIAHQRLHEISIRWQKILVGYFAELQQDVFGALERLEAHSQTREVTSDALNFLEERFTVHLPPQLRSSSLETRRRFAETALDRPLRVCGVVENTGEPGGGPFWVRDTGGQISGQIIEGAQIDTTSESQLEIWRSSTHFNPVHVVCGLRDRHGKPYRLLDYVDPATAFVTEKTHEGRPIRALERPGLWNGSMAKWNTAFVEVPIETFTPVKTVFDLLRPEHQP
jgi:hypothetical protein